MSSYPVQSGRAAPPLPLNSYELAAGIEDTIAEFYCGPNLGGKNEIYCYALPRKAGANYYYLSADSGKTFIKVPTEYTFSRLIVSKQTQGLVMAAREDTVRHLRSLAQPGCKRRVVDDVLALAVPRPPPPAPLPRQD